MSADLGLRISAGTTTLLRALPRLVWAGEWRETLARWVLTAIVGSIGITAMALHWWLIPVAVVVWCAVAAAVPLPEQEDDEDQDDEDDEPPLDADVFTELVHDVAQGRNVHLTAIRAQLVEETRRDWDVLALCRAAGITTKPVRVPGADPAVTTGIHRTDLPPLPRPLSAAPVDVVVAGQHDNNNTNTTIERIGEGGLIIKTGPSARQGVRR